MGVQGSGGVGGGITRRRPSHIAYYIALVGILALLVLLLLYFFYFFINKIRKFNSTEFSNEPTTSCRPPAAATAYPVQPVVREGASEMAKLCKQLPPGKGGTVFPTSTSPAAIHTDTGEAPADPAASTVTSASTMPTVPTVENTDTAPPSTEPAVIKSTPTLIPAVVVESITIQ